MAEQDSELKLSLVKKQACFSKLLENETIMLSELLIEQCFKKDEIIVTQGDPVDSVYFIVDGTANVRIDRVEDGKIVSDVVAQMGPGAAIGLSETGFYSLSGMRTATVSATEPMRTYRLSVAAFNGFALAHPHVNEVMRSQ